MYLAGNFDAYVSIFGITYFQICSDFLVTVHITIFREKSNVKRDMKSICTDFLVTVNISNCENLFCKIFLSLYFVGKSVCRCNVRGHRYPFCVRLGLQCKKVKNVGEPGIKVFDNNSPGNIFSLTCLGGCINVTKVG